MTQSEFVDRHLESAENLLFSDEEVREAVETAFDLAHALNLPPSIRLLFLQEHRLTLRRICEALGLIFLHRHEPERLDTDDSAALLQENELISQSPHSSIEEVEDWLTRRLALAIGLRQCERIAFASEVLGEPMPPFEAEADSQKRENLRSRNEILERLHGSDQPLKNRLERVEQAINEGREVPPAVWSTVIGKDVQNHLERLVASHHSQFTDHVGSFIQKAEEYPSLYEEQRHELIDELAEVATVHGLAASHAITPSSEESEDVEDLLWRTDSGAEWWVENGWDDLGSFRKRLQKRLRNALLKLCAWQKVRDEMDRHGDPQEASIGPAPVTARVGSRKQLSNLREAREVLLSNPAMRGAKQGVWKTEVERRSIERLGKDCFGIPSKKNWPERYRGYKGGGFANLIEDLWDGTWTEHV